MSSSTAVLLVLTPLLTVVTTRLRYKHVIKKMEYPSYNHAGWHAIAVGAVTLILGGIVAYVANL